MVLPAIPLAASGLAALAPYLAQGAKHLAPYALEAIKHASPTLGKILGSEALALGKPSVSTFLKLIVDKAKSPEGRTHLLNAVESGSKVGAKVFREGLDFAKGLGVSGNTINKIENTFNKGEKNLHNVLGAVNKIRKRFSFF